MEQIEWIKMFPNPDHRMRNAQARGEGVLVSINDLTFIYRVSKNVRVYELRTDMWVGV